MKVCDILHAGAVMRKLCDQDLTLKSAYRLAIVIDRLNPFLAYFDNHADKITNKADSPEMDELMNEDLDIGDVPPIEISLNENVTLTPFDVVALRPFVTFIDTGDR